MPFGNRKNYFRGCFQFGIATIQKIPPTWKPEISLFRHFPKLKIAEFNGKKILSISLKADFHSKYFGLFWLNLPPSIFLKLPEL